MENLREQIFQATDNFLAVLQQLAQQQTTQVFEETLASLGNGHSKGKGALSAPKTRGAKRGSEELEQLSNRFVQFVRDNPGLRIEQINKQLSTTTKDLALPIRKLISEGQIKVKGQKRSTTYFAGKSAGKSAAADAASDEEAGKTETAAPAPKSGKKRSRSKKSRARRSKSKK